MALSKLLSDRHCAPSLRALPREVLDGLLDRKGHEGRPNLKRDRRVPVRLWRRAIGLSLALIAPLGMGIPATRAAGTPVMMQPQLDRAAASAQAEAERLLEGRPYQVVLMQDHRVLMSTSSPGSSLKTPVPLASVSKAVTALVIMHLIENGLLRLDQPLGEILPAEMITDPWKPVTIEQLLTHQSGFGADRDRWFNSSYRTCFEAFTRTVFRDNPSGSRAYEYSNTNFCALSLAIIAVTGVSYEEATFRYVLRPLGVSRQTMNDEYVNLLGAGGWQMSALATARLISALDPQSSISPLSDTSRRTMIQRSTYNYGLGVWIWDENTFGHSGTLNRARNIGVRLPSGRVVVILTQATYPESGLDLLPIAQRIDQNFGSACAQDDCDPVGPDPFFGDQPHPLRQTYH